MRMTLKISFVTVLLFAVLCGVASGQSSARWLAAADGDLVATSLTVPLGLKAATVPHEPASFSWVIDSDKALDLRSAPLSSESREYWVEVTAGDLAGGVPIFTDGGGALVRINPAPGEKALEPIDPVVLTLADPAGKVWSGGTGMELIADAGKLRAAGAPFVEGTAAFRIRGDLGAGTFTLRAENLAGAGRYVLQVLDRASDIALRLTSLQADYLHGQKLRLEATLVGETSSKVRFEGFVTSPAGRAWPVVFQRLDGGAFGAELTLDALEIPAPGLWQANVAAHAMRKGDVALMRSARIPFQVAVPSARFDGSVALSDGLALRLGVDVVAASRYEVRGVLFGTGADGQLVPAAVAHGAAWLEPGLGGLELRFDRSEVEASGLRAPFEVRDLRLVDQGTMGLLHRQARGLALSE